MFKYIIEDTLDLRLLEKRHSDELYKVIDKSRKHLRTWLPWVDDTTSSLSTKEFIRGTLKNFINKTGVTCGIFLNEKIVGVISFNSISYPEKQANIGYWISKKHTGKGIIIKACNAMINYGIYELKLNKINIFCGEENYRSRAIPKRLGFKKVGVLQENEWLYDHFIDHVLYSMLAREWILKK